MKIPKIIPGNIRTTFTTEPALSAIRSIMDDPSPVQNGIYCELDVLLKTKDRDKLAQTLKDCREAGHHIVLIFSGNRAAQMGRFRHSGLVKTLLGEKSEEWLSTARPFNKFRLHYTDQKTATALKGTASYTVTGDDNNCSLLAEKYLSASSVHQDNSPLDRQQGDKPQPANQ